MNPSLTEREASEIGRAVLRYSSRYGLEPGLVAAIIKVESSANPFAVSSKGAQGLMQVMPFWKRELGVHGTLFDIDNNINVGCRILAENIRRWGFEEGIARYYRGNLPVSGEKYIVKVKAALGGFS
ncbi:MAG: lytic transglycosylase domain-containing protein [Deltaproteobacteria bacterium]|nr:lytic transglycosylase domain-containing protein [Deltaproteobacteria bacterium]